MDIESATGPPIAQATEEDLHGVLAGDFGPSLRLVRNYGDRLEVEAADGGAYRLAYYDAPSGRWRQAEEVQSLEQIKEAFLDYFQGKWNWHGGHVWRTITRAPGTR